MTEKKDNQNIEQTNIKKDYKIHLYVFLGMVILMIILSWILPIVFDVRENLVEKYLMVIFALFLSIFLFWIK